MLPKGDRHSLSYADDDAGGDVMLIRSIIKWAQHVQGWGNFEVN